MHQRDIYLSLGSNMGEREATLHEALRLLKEAFPVGFIVSPFYSTAPWGNTNQDSFINCCCKLQSDIPITDLLTICQNIEHSMGRARTIPWGARTLDIDIVLAGDEVVQTEQLTIPHRYMAERRFVLVPLADIAPKAVHPVLHQSVAALLADCPDNNDVTPIAGRFLH